MPEPNLSLSREASPDLAQSNGTSPTPVEIPSDRAIDIQEALSLATQEHYPIGKSTLQRRAMYWKELGAASPVKSVLVYASGISQPGYRMDREDFLSWILQQKSMSKSPEASPDATRPLETPSDLMRPIETSPDRAMPHRQTEAIQSRETSDAEHRYVRRLEHDLERLEKELDTKTTQITQLNKTLDAIVVTNSQQQVLMQGLQTLIAPVLGLISGSKEPAGSKITTTSLESTPVQQPPTEDPRQ